MGVGQRLKELRKARGLSQEQLAELLNLTHPTVSKMERGQAKIDADRLPRFAEVLKVSPCDFFETRREAPYEPTLGDELAADTLDVLSRVPPERVEVLMDFLRYLAERERTQSS